MASIIKANQLQDFGGNSIIGSDGAGNLTTQKTFYPAFFAYSNSDQTVTDAAVTKVQFQTEEFDTDNAFDNSTNYRFTVPTGKDGKYYVSTGVYMEEATGSGIDRTVLYVYKNGSQEALAYFDLASGDFRATPVISVMLDLVAGDYLEVYGVLDSLGSAPKFKSSTISTYFGGYRIGS